MTSIAKKVRIGKEDLNIQYNPNLYETFPRRTTLDTEINITKFPDIWDGTGKVNSGAILVRALDDNDLVMHSFGIQSNAPEVEDRTGNYLRDTQGNLILDSNGNPIEIIGG